MKEDNEFKHIEALLSGKIRQPSPRFEEALRQIPVQAAPVRQVSAWAAYMKIASIAAAITLFVWTGIDLSLSDQAPSAEEILQDDQDLLTLFSLSNDLEMAEVLLSEDNLLALDYLTSTP